MIINPDALFKTPQAEQEFIMEMKNYIKDVIDINNREAVQYGTDTSNRTEQETIKD